MTCIVGPQHGGVVWIGADSAAVSRERLRSRADPKAFRVGPYVMGFTTPFRVGDVLRHGFNPPSPPERNLNRFMATAFVDATRDAFKTALEAAERFASDVRRPWRIVVGGS